MKKKLLAILLSLLTLIFASNPTVVVLAESYSDSTVESVDTSLNYSISAPSDNQVVISDSTGETLLTQIDDNHFTMTRDDGSVSAVEVDNQGNVYVDGTLAKAADEISNTNTVVEKQYSTRAITNWHYLDTIYNDTNIQGQREAIALTLVGMIPYLGPAVTIASIIQAVKNYGSPVMYITTKRYYANGYQYYKYVNYFYSDPGRTNLVRITTEIKKMW